MEDRGNRFLSPVGVVQLASDSAEQGLSEVLFLFAIINMFVGILNLAPLPPFDGGHIVMALYEGIRSKITGRRYYADFGKLLPARLRRDHGRCPHRRFQPLPGSHQPDPFAVDRSAWS